jgi:hypothetical protein
MARAAFASLLPLPDTLVYLLELPPELARAIFPGGFAA